MFAGNVGEITALMVAVFWSMTAISFEYASKRVGSLPVNIIRLVLGFIFLSILNLILRGLVFPTDASAHNWIWLTISGLIGFVLGDLFLFQSYTIIGSWFAMLIMTLAPPMAAIFGFFILDERIGGLAILGMFITLFGISLTMFKPDRINRKMVLNKPLKGILRAFMGAFGQALGIVFSKYGMRDYNAFASTQIRIIAGIAGFIIVIFISKKWSVVFDALRNRKAMTGTTIGSFFGPFLGVSFSLVAVQHTSTGIASTLMAMVPVFLIPASIIFFGHKVTLLEVAGAVISLIGVTLFFM